MEKSVLEIFGNINDLYLEFRHNPDNEEVRSSFKELLGALAEAIAPEFPTREHKLGNLGEIYITLYELATSDYSTDFLADAIYTISKEFGKSHIQNTKS